MIKSSPVVCHDRIVTGVADGAVYCLDTKGRQIWKKTTSNGVEASALIFEKRVYIGNLDGTFYCLDLENGNELWQYKTENQIIGSANWVKTDKHTSVLFGSYDFYLHSVDAGTGKGIWKYESDNYINGAAACFGGDDRGSFIRRMISGCRRRQSLDRGLRWPVFMCGYWQRGYPLEMEGREPETPFPCITCAGR